MRMKTTEATERMETTEDTEAMKTTEDTEGTVLTQRNGATEASREDRKKLVFSVSSPFLRSSVFYRFLRTLRVLRGR
jgi:hypothetical protein